MKSMKNLSKRGLSLLLALVMCLGMVQITAFAEETELPAETAQVEAAVDVNGTEAETDSTGAADTVPDSTGNLSDDVENDEANPGEVVTDEDGTKTEETEEVKTVEAEEIESEETEEVKSEKTEEVKSEKTEEVKSEKTEEVKSEKTEEVKPEKTEEVKPEETAEADGAAKDSPPEDIEPLKEQVESCANGDSEPIEEDKSGSGKPEPEPKLTFAEMGLSPTLKVICGNENCELHSGKTVSMPVDIDFTVEEETVKDGRRIAVLTPVGIEDYVKSMAGNHTCVKVFPETLKVNWNINSNAWSFGTNCSNLTVNVSCSKKAEPTLIQADSYTWIWTSPKGCKVTVRLAPILKIACHPGLIFRTVSVMSENGQSDGVSINGNSLHYASKPVTALIWVEANELGTDGATKTVPVQVHPCGEDVFDFTVTFDMDQEVTVIKEHSYGEWVIDKEPSLTEAGHKYHTCTVKTASGNTCTGKEEDTIPMLKPRLEVSNDGLKEVKVGDTVTWTVTMKNNDDPSKGAFLARLTNIVILNEDNTVLEFNGTEMCSLQQLMPVLPGKTETLIVTYTVTGGEVGDTVQIPLQFADSNADYTAVTTLECTIVSEKTDKIHTVTWLPGYGANTPIDSKEYDKGTTTVPAGDYLANPTRPGYTFIGWGEPVTDANGNITITARWSRNSTGGGGGTTTTTPDPVVDISDENPPLAEEPDVDVDIPDEEPPLADIPDEEPPLADIPDVDVPLDDTPQTSDSGRTALWAGMCAVSLAGVVILSRKKEDEEA